MDRPDAPALLIIRTWREDGTDRSFRAQIRMTADTSSGSTTTVNVADPDRVVDVVRAFLNGEPTFSV